MSTVVAENSRSQTARSVRNVRPRKGDEAARQPLARDSTLAGKVLRRTADVRTAARALLLRLLWARFSGQSSRLDARGRARAVKAGLGQHARLLLRAATLTGGRRALPGRGRGLAVVEDRLHRRRERPGGQGPVAVPHLLCARAVLQAMVERRLHPVTGEQHIEGSQAVERRGPDQRGADEAQARPRARSLRAERVCAGDRGGGRIAGDGYALLADTAVWPQGKVETLRPIGGLELRAAPAER